MPGLIETFVIAVLVLAAATAPWWPAAWRKWRRARLAQEAFPTAWRRILARRMPLYRRLPPPLQQRLRKQMRVFLAEKPFIGCDGLKPTLEMRVLVAAQACLLLLNRPPGGFEGLREVLLYPSAFVVQRSATDAIGLQRDERRVLAGESWQRGQVILSWPDVVAGAADPADGRNVVIHEFAHQLDQEAGAANGAPFLGARERYAGWSQALGAAYADLQRRVAAGEPGVLDPYGAQEPAEFFAVASEAFFEQPAALAAEQPALYAELATYYRVDPRAW